MPSSASRLALALGVLGAVLFGVAAVADRQYLVAGTLLAGQLGSCVGIVLGIRRNQPTFRLPWLCALLSVSCLMTGFVASVAGLQAVSDVFYLVQYPFLIVALFLLSHRRLPGRDLGPWIDMAIVVVALTLPAWIYVIGPTVERGGPVLDLVLSTAYPVLDLVLLAAGLHLSLGSERRQPVLTLLGLGVLAELGGDSATLVGTLAGWADPRGVNPFGALYLVALGALAAAALHPSMVRIHHRVSEPSTSVSGRRLLFLAGVSLVPPAVGLAQAADGGSEHGVLSAISGACLTTLALGRAWLLVVEQRRLAVTDGLTGLNTRRFFDEALTVALHAAARSGARVGVLLLDVDHFKRINDAHGHPAGDAVLRELALRLRAAVRPGDVVARYGGEEFAALLTPIDLDALRELGERVRGGVCAEPFRFGDDLLMDVTVSVGAAAAPDHADTAAHLTLVADQFLYQAKANGRNQVVSGDPDQVLVR